MSKANQVRVGRNPLEKLNLRQSSQHLQSRPRREKTTEPALVRKMRQLEIQFDWRQFYDQAMPGKLKNLTRKLLSIKR